MGIAKIKWLHLTHLLFLALIFSSCARQKYFFRSNQINYIKPSVIANSNDPQPGDTRGADTLIGFKMLKGFKATVQDKEKYLVLKVGKDFNMTDSSRSIIKIPIVITDDLSKQIDFVGTVAQLKGKYFVPQIVYDSLPSGRICYFDSKPVLQTLTIPIKIRPKLTTPALKDSFPSQVETGVNVGVAFGWKFNFNFYKPTANIFGQKGNRISLTPGFFYGVGGTSLTKGNTRNPTIIFERKAFMHNLGGFAMLGFNTVNIGYTLGWDFATGPQKESWLYQGKVWHGVAFSIDLIK